VLTGKTQIMCVCVCRSSVCATPAKRHAWP